MKKKPTGRIDSAQTKTRASRPKAELEAVGTVVDRALKSDTYSPPDPKTMTYDQLKSRVSIIDRCEELWRQLLRGSIDEQLATLEQLKIGWLALAGNNIGNAVFFAEAIGETRALIIEAPKLKAIEAQRAALPKARENSARLQKEHAANTNQIILRLNAELLTHPDSARWTLEERAKYIEQKLKEWKTVQLNKSPYKASSIKTKITGKG